MYQDQRNYGTFHFFERNNLESKTDRAADSKAASHSRNRDMTPFSALEIYRSLVTAGIDTAYQYATGIPFFNPVYQMPDLTLSQIEARALHPVIPELLAFLKDKNADGNRFMILLDALLDDPDDKKNYVNASLPAKKDILTIVEYAMLHFSDKEIRASINLCKEKINHQITSATTDLRSSFRA